MKSNKTCKIKNFVCDLLHKDFQTQKYLKHFLFGALAIALVAVIVLIFVGFNNQFAYRSGYTYTVSFHTEITEQERSDYNEIIENVLRDNNVTKYQLNQLGDSYDSAIMVRFVTKIKDVDTLLENIETQTDDMLSERVSYLSVSDIETYESAWTNSVIWLGILGVFVVLAVVAVYTIIRFDWVSMVSVTIVNAYNILVLLALTILLRIPVSGMLFVGLCMTQLLTSLFAIHYFVKIKDGFIKETNLNLTNLEIMHKMTKESKTTFSILAGVFALLSIALIATGQLVAIEAGMLLWLGSWLAIFVNLVLTLPIWNLWFNRNKDKRLQHRLLEKNMPKKTEDEKITV